MAQQVAFVLRGEFDVKARASGALGPRAVAREHVSLPDVEGELRAVWQDCLAGSDRHARSARFIVNELGGSFRPSATQASSRSGIWTKFG